MPAPSSELEVASQSSAASHSTNIAIASMHSRLEGLLYYQTSFLASTKHNFLWELIPTVTISKRSIKEQQKASQEKGKYPTSHRDISQGERTLCRTRTFQLGWLLKEINAAHVCHSAGCKYVFFKHSKKTLISNTERGRERYTNNI